MSIDLHHTQLHFVCFVRLTLQILPSEQAILQNKVTVGALLLGNGYRATVDVQVVVTKHFRRGHVEVAVYKHVTTG